LAEKHVPVAEKGGTQRWSQTFAGFLRNALFYGIFGECAVIGRESLPLIPHFQSIKANEFCSRPSVDATYLQHAALTIDIVGCKRFPKP
jgi:hypothetical protein